MILSFKKFDNLLLYLSLKVGVNFMNSQHLRLKWHFEKLDKYGPRKLKSTCGGYSGSFLSFSKRSVCVSPLFVCESYLVLSVPHFAKK